MKTFYRIAVALLLTAPLLIACSKDTKQQSKQAVTPTEATSQKSVFTSQTGGFSIEAPSNFQSSDSSTLDAVANKAVEEISLENQSQLQFLHALRYDKASIAVSMDQLASKILAQSVQTEALKQLTYTPMTLAGKSGYGVTTDFTDNDIAFHFLSFIYEDNNYYKLLVVQTETASKDQATPELEAVINSWQDIPVNKTYDLSQVISLPTVSMTLTIPSDWSLEARTDGDSHTVDYFNKEKNKYLSVYANNVAEGYTFDLTGFVTASAANISPAATTKEIAVGSHTGYVIEAVVAIDEIWSNTIVNYIFQVENRTISIYFSIPSGEIDAFRPTMEAIVSSLQ